MILKFNTWNCPECKIKMWFKNIGGLLAREDDKYSAMCPKCNSYYSVHAKRQRKVKAK